jgi:cytochrome c5
MKPYGTPLVLISLLLGCAAFGFAATADDGAKVFADSCSPCHSAGSRPLDTVHLTRAQWEETIDRMIGFGADVPSKKMPALLDYLVNTHGPTGASTDADKNKK